MQITPLFLPDFNGTWILLTDLRKIFKYQISWKLSESFHADGGADGREANRRLSQFCGRSDKWKSTEFSLLASPNHKMNLRGPSILLHELNLIPVYSYYRFISTVFHTVCPSDVKTILSESTEFSSNKPDVLEEVTTRMQKSELVGVSSWETSWSISNTYTYHSYRVTKQRLWCPVLSTDSVGPRFLEACNYDRKCSRISKFSDW